MAALRSRRYNAASERFRHAFRVASTSPQQLVALLDAAAVPSIQPEAGARAPASAEEQHEWRKFQYLSFVWREFRHCGQLDSFLAFAEPCVDGGLSGAPGALSSNIASLLREVAPHQSAALIGLVFSSALSLGRIPAARQAILRLHANAPAERAAGRDESASRFDERTNDALRALVSELAARGGLHVLATLHFEPPSPRSCTRR